MNPPIKQFSNTIFVVIISDSEVPDLFITSDTPAESNSPRQTIRWTSSEQANFECTLDGQKVDCGTGTSGVYTTPNMPDGRHTFSVNAVDPLGNKGTPKVIEWNTGKKYWERYVRLAFCIHVYPAVCTSFISIYIHICNSNINGMTVISCAL